MQNKIFIAIAAVVIIAVGAWWFWSNQNAASQENQEQGGSEQNEPAGNEGNSEEVIVRATENGYEPESITVSEGTTVTFVNESSRPVWTASDVHPTHQIMPEFDTLKGFVPGENYSYTFREAGTWRYHDHLRPQHTGEIIVE